MPSEPKDVAGNSWDDMRLGEIQRLGHGLYIREIFDLHHDNCRHWFIFNEDDGHCFGGFHDGPTGWDVIETPNGLTVRPSLLIDKSYKHDQIHGFITEGKWVPV